MTRTEAEQAMTAACDELAADFRAGCDRVAERARERTDEDAIASFDVTARAINAVRTRFAAALATNEGEEPARPRSAPAQAMLDAADRLAADIHARCEFLADLFEHAPPELAEQALGPFSAKLEELREMFVEAATVKSPN